MEYAQPRGFRDNIEPALITVNRARTRLCRGLPRRLTAVKIALPRAATAMARAQSGGAGQMYDFGQLGAMLQDADAAVGAAECHGFLCGQLCGPTQPDDTMWQEFLDLRTSDDRVAEECYRQVRGLMQDTRRQMWAEDFDFRLCLPDEDAGMAGRVEALAAWCQGFLTGFGLAPGAPVRMLSPDAQEWLGDMDMIARAGADEPDADDELALVQVEDHVRTGVMLIIEEMRAFSDAGSAEA